MNPIVKTTRDSRFELLRIFSMLLIIMHHLAFNAGIAVSAESAKLNVAILDLFAVGGKFGVNIFVLISGYFLVFSKFKVKKLVKLILQVFFYSVVFYVVFLILDKANFNFHEIKLNFFPVIFERYWFVTCYVFLYCFSPFLNRCINNLSQKEHFLLVLLMFFVASVVPYVTDLVFVSNLGWFVFLYTLGAFVRRFDLKGFDKAWLCGLIALGTYAFIVLAKIYLHKDYWAMTDAVCLCSSLMTFLAFKNLKHFKCNTFINIVSSATFGVYLIHENVFFRTVMWKDILKAPAHFLSPYFPIYAFVVVIVVFVFCCLIDLARLYFVEKPLFGAFDRVIAKCKQKSQTKD